MESISHFLRFVNTAPPQFENPFRFSPNFAFLCDILCADNAETNPINQQQNPLDISSPLVYNRLRFVKHIVRHVKQ